MNLRRTVSIVLIAMGIGVMAYPTASHMYYDAQQNQAMADWEQLMSQDIQQTPAEDVAPVGPGTPAQPDPVIVTTPSAVTPAAVQDPEAQAKAAAAAKAAADAEAQRQKELKAKQAKARADYLAKHTLGILQISAIKLKVPVLDDATANNLNIAPSKVRGTGKPGAVGNFCIAGHRMQNYGRHFNRLNELAVGHTATFKLPDRELKYVVTEVKRVLPSEVSVLRSHGFKEMTLITCDPINNPTHRLIVTLKEVQ